MGGTMRSSICVLHGDGHIIPNLFELTLAHRVIAIARGSAFPFHAYAPSDRVMGTAPPSATVSVCYDVPNRGADVDGHA